MNTNQYRYFNEKSDYEKKSWIKNIIKRMKVAYGLSENSKYSELSKAAKIGESVIKNWVTTKRLPFKAIANCVFDTNKDFDWILFGTEKKLTFNENEQLVMKNIIANKLIAQIDYWDMMCSPEGIERLSETIKKGIVSELTNEKQIDNKDERLTLMKKYS